jgi:hypothetical protein
VLLEERREEEAQAQDITAEIWRRGNQPSTPFPATMQQCWFSLAIWGIRPWENKLGREAPESSVKGIGACTDKLDAGVCREVGKLDAGIVLLFIRCFQETLPIPAGRLQLLVMAPLCWACCRQEGSGSKDPDRQIRQACDAERCRSTRGGGRLITVGEPDGLVWVAMGVTRARRRWRSILEKWRGVTGDVGVFFFFLEKMWGAFLFPSFLTAGGRSRGHFY